MTKNDDSYGRTWEEELHDRREGNTLRAKFFRWKDEVLPPEVRRDFMERNNQDGISIPPNEQRTDWLPHADAVGILKDHPNDPEAYLGACWSLAPIYDKVDALGFELPPWKDPPDPPKVERP